VPTQASMGWELTQKTRRSGGAWRGERLPAIRVLDGGSRWRSATADERLGLGSQAGWREKKQQRGDFEAL